MQRGKSTSRDLKENIRAHLGQLVHSYLYGQLTSGEQFAWASVQSDQPPILG